MVEIFGNADSRFEPVRGVIAGVIDSGQDVGVSVAVAVDGKPVVDLWGGHVDEARTTSWERDTITNVWSITKTVTALCALVLVDRGLVDLDAPVAKYWPEFAENGKEGVLVKHLLSHTSGVAGWERPVDVTDLYDWETSTERLARQAPWWEPGTASGYHTLSYGHLIGEVVRRVTGKKLGEFLTTEVAGPLGADFHIGLPDEAFGRVSFSIASPPAAPVDLSQVDLESVRMRSVLGPVPPVSASFTDEWKRADIGAANGHGNARSVVRLQSLVTSEGEIDGVRLLSPDTIELIFQEQANGTDLVLGDNVHWGIGYCLEYTGRDFLPKGRVAFWGGRGGSMVVNDLDRGITLAFVQNRLAADSLGSPSSAAVIEAIYDAL